MAIGRDHWDHDTHNILRPAVELGQWWGESYACGHFHQHRSIVLAIGQDHWDHDYFAVFQQDNVWPRNHHHVLKMRSRENPVTQLLTEV